MDIKSALYDLSEKLDAVRQAYNEYEILLSRQVPEIGNIHGRIISFLNNKLEDVSNGINELIRG